MLKKVFFAIYIFLFAYPGYGQEGENILFRAMDDELKRTTTRLKIEKKAPPYYVSYTINDVEKLVIEGNFGAITYSYTDHERRLITDLRVGDYNFDNSNFVPGREGFFIEIKYGEYSGSPLPLENNYDAIRHHIYLETDRLYKDALDQLSKKEATIKHRKILEPISDFSKSGPFSYIGQAQRLTVDKERWTEIVKELSKTFKEFAKIQTSRVVFSSRIVNQYFVDSEGNKYLKSTPLTSIESFATTQASDGMPLRDNIGFYTFSPDQLPPVESMKSSIREMAQTLSNQTALKKEEKEYSGPVLFISEASGELFYQLLAKGISNPRPPIYEQEEMAALEITKEGFLADKIGEKILPANFSVYDDPTLSQLNNIPLIGSYLVDDQGVKAQKTEIVKDGKLVGVVMSKAPIKTIPKSTGNGRFLNGKCVGRISNLIIENNNPKANIESEFINLLKEEGLDYGIVVTKLETPKVKTVEEMSEEILSSFFTTSKPPRMLSSAVIAYKLYPDGKRELLRGLEFEGVTHRILKDIVAGGESSIVYNFTIGETGEGGLPASIVSCPVIVRNMVLVAKEGKATKAPFLPHPFFDKK